MINKELVLKLHQKYNDGQADWKKIVEEYNSITGEKRSRASLRSVVYRANTFDSSQTITKNERKEILVNKMITIHEGDLADDWKVLDAIGYDADLWVVKESKFTVSEVASKQGDLYNYHASVKVAPKEIKDLGLKDYVKILKTIQPIPPIKFKENTSDNAFRLVLTDKHIGSGVFNQQAYLRMVAKAKRTVQDLKPAKVFIDLLGDILHVDNVLKTTNKGTQLEMPMSAYEMVRLADELIIHTIKELSIVPTQVNWVSGNHSHLAEYQLMMGVERYFRNSKHITFNVGEERKKAYKIYNTFIGLHHGDMPKANMYNWLQFDFKEIWGQSDRWELHTGHFHNLEVKTVGGLEHTQHGVDIYNTDYEDNLGFVNYFYKTFAYMYNKEDGNYITFRY